MLPISNVYLPTNCGNITPQFFNICQMQTPPNITKGHVSYFHSLLCDWALNVPLNFQWVAVITAKDKEYLFNQIKQTVSSIEPKGWNIGSSVDATWTSATQDVIGCIFAQGVDLPGETINTKYVGIEESSNRGFIKSPIIEGRTDFTTLNMGFLETNRSFVDGVLRPWSILVAHKGLIASQQSIKANIDVYELAKNGDCNPTVIRKMWHFEDCAPIFIDQEQKKYDSNGSYALRHANFVYNSYYVTDYGNGMP